SGTTEGLHPAQSRRVQEAELADREFRIRAKQPGRRDKADNLSRQEREIFQASLRSNRGLHCGQIKKLSFSRRVNFCRPFCPKRVRILFFPLMEITVQDWFVTTFNHSGQPTLKPGIPGDRSPLVMIGNDQE